MTQKYLLIVLAFSCLKLNAQYEMEIPEPGPGESKTEFRHSYFQANYRNQNILLHFLNKAPHLVSSNIKRVEYEALDLYYPKSSKYEHYRTLPTWFLYNHVIPREDKIKSLDSIPGLKPSWKESLAKSEFLSDVFRIQQFKYNFSTEDQALIASSRENRAQTVYKFHFTKSGQLSAARQGRLNSFQDTSFWISTTYQYHKGVLQKSIYKICNDAECKKGYEETTIAYIAGRPLSSTHKVISRHQNQFIYQTITDFHYTDAILDSSVSKTYFMGGPEPELKESESLHYDDGKVMQKVHNWMNSPSNGQMRAKSQYRYNSDGLLSSESQMAWDGAQQLIKTLEITYSYQQDSFSYRYVEGINIVDGIKKLPLQYLLQIQLSP